MNDTFAQAMDRIWQSYGDNASWVFTSHPTQFGDLYACLAVFHNFRFRNRGHIPIKLIVGTPGHLAIARMFGHLFDAVHHVPELATIPAQEMQEWSLARRKFNFAPGNLIWLHPFYYCFPQFEIASLMNRGRANYSELCRLGLRLPFELAAMPPHITEAMRASAQQLAVQHGVIPGKTILLFPYSRSIKQDCTVHFAAFAGLAKQDGYRVLTSVAGAEQPIVGTEGVNIPFDLLIPYCEMAGRVVAARSGVSDIICTAQCFKMDVYSFESHLDIFSISDYELGGNAVEVIFPFAERGVEDFLALYPRVREASLSDMYNTIPSPVSRYLLAHRAETKPQTTIGDPIYVHSFGKYRAIGGVVLGTGWSGIERWGIWSTGFRAFLYLGNPYAQSSSDPIDPQRITIRLNLTAALNERHTTHRISISLGDSHSSYEFIAGRPHPEVTLAVPLDLSDDPCLKVVIDIHTPHSPTLNSADPRLLGIGLISVVFAVD